MYFQAIQEDDSFNIGLASGEFWYERGHLWCVPYVMVPHQNNGTEARVLSDERKLSQAKFLTKVFDTNIYVFIRYFFNKTELSTISDLRKNAENIEDQYYQFKAKRIVGKGVPKEYRLVRRSEIPNNCWKNVHIQLSSATKPSTLRLSYMVVFVFLVLRLMK